MASCTIVDTGFEDPSLEAITLLLVTPNRDSLEIYLSPEPFALLSRQTPPLETTALLLYCTEEKRVILASYRILPTRSRPSTLIVR